MERRQQIQSTGAYDDTRETNTSQTCSDRAHATDPSNGSLAPLRDAIKFNTSETHRVLTSKLGACCVVVRNVDLWAPPPPAAVDVRAAPPTVTTRAACVYSSDGNAGVISEERLAKLHKMYGHGTGADTMEEQGPKATLVSQRP
jgi:hypothetical protein